MTLPMTKPVRFQLRIVDFYVLAVVTCVLIWLYRQIELTRPKTTPVILIACGVTLAWLAALVFRPGKLGEGYHRVIRLLFRIFWIPVVLILARMLLFLLFPPTIRCYANTAPGQCLTFLNAQQTYIRVDYNSDGVLEYARTMKELYRDGMINLVDRALANAEIPTNSNPVPKAGYLYRVLYAQGPHAMGGARSYLDEKGRLTQGFALLAIPEDWELYRLTFMINQSGGMYQKDLGPDTLDNAEKIQTFDPDKSWESAE